MANRIQEMKWIQQTLFALASASEFQKAGITYEMMDEIHTRLEKQKTSKRHTACGDKKPGVNYDEKSSGRANNKNNEEKELAELVILMNENVGKGKDLREQYEKIFNTTFVGAVIAGSRKDHFDIIIYNLDGSSKNIEVKQTKNICNLDNFKKPWEKSVQAVNIRGEDLGVLGEYYLRNLYKIVYKNERIYENMDLNKEDLVDIESFIEDMYKYNLKTSFMLKFKEELKKIYGKSNYYSNFQKQYSILFEEVICKTINIFDEKIEEETRSSLQNKLNKAFEVKDAWLSISGNIASNNFTFRWWSKIPTPKIENIKLRSEDHKLYINYILDKGSSETYIRMRNAPNNLSCDYK
tara:strand:+ start:92 stop:1147 length:1056 start_codon:yes stop_codon:yes gene_type:complete